MVRVETPDVLRETLRRHRRELARMGVRSLALFGSAARGELTPESDIDILVEFAAPPGFRRYMQVRGFLEELLGRKVDLVMRDALKPEMRRRLQLEPVDVT